MGSGVWGLGISVYSGFRQGLGFRVWGLGFWGLGLGDEGLGVQGLGGEGLGLGFGHRRVDAQGP